jgi:alcohol dehydrogenase YqhD (iron-dependent ADH family)
LPRFAQFGRRVWNVCDEDDEAAAKNGIEKTVAFFRSIGMPVCLSDLDVDVTEDILPQLALDATANDTLRLSRIRPLNAKDVEAIYRLAIKN